eukprot:CAMPEP_0118939600 /NCGR_PEP_ID=MMETSP1169-20130426/29316_1 /TAXON_ID=36882 /ORGANISM="Pyramimonas obovata, Strain CCMP722" /LENGTH=262 /DNA_ID=CAMNT_0006883907 /DNA_START=86 /DNA_END=871 /DNA_ORIENTATION=+
MTGVEAEPVDRLQENVSPEYFFHHYYVQRKPVILSKVARSWPARKKWSLEAMRSMVCEHSDVDTVECVAHSKTDPTHYSNVTLPSMGRYFDYLEQCVAHKKPQEAALKNGVTVPRSVVEAACPVPKVLKTLHNDRKLALRDMLGREKARLFISAGGFHGRCHYDRFGYAFFSVQVKGAKTWYLYKASSLPLRRLAAFDNAPLEDFTRPEVHNGHSGWVAKLQEGDMLFLPPLTYHSVCHTGGYNVNIDFACLPDVHWVPAIR